MNDQREHPSSSPPLMFLSQSVSPVYSTCVTDVTDVDTNHGGSVRVSRKLNLCNRHYQMHISRNLVGWPPHEIAISRMHISRNLVGWPPHEIAISRMHISRNLVGWVAM